MSAARQDRTEKCSLRFAGTTIAEKAGVNREPQSQRLPDRWAWKSGEGDFGLKSKWRKPASRRTDRSNKTSQPVTEEVFITREIGGIVALIEDEWLGVDACDEAFTGRE